MTLNEVKMALLLNGGATYTPKGEEILTTEGYLVSLAGSEKITTIDNLTERDLKYYFKLAKKKHGFFGLWLDDNGNLYLDVSIKIRDKATARKVGKHNNQRAIFDLSNKTCIYLN